MSGEERSEVVGRRSKNKRSALTSDLLTSVVGLVGTRTIGLVAGILLARLLDPADRGRFAVAALGALAVGTAATLGSEYWISAATARGIEYRRVARVSGRRVVSACAAITIFALIWVMLPFARDSLPIVIAAAAWAAVNVVSMLMLAQLGGQRRLRRVAIAQMTSSLGFALAVLVLLIVNVREVWIVLSFAAGSSLLLAGASWQPGALSIETPDPLDQRAARRLGLPAMLGEVAGQLAGRVSFILIGALLTSDDVGLFVVAMSIADVLLIIPNGISQVLLPQVAKDGHGRSTGPIVAMSTALGLVGVGAIFIFGQVGLTTMFGVRYSSAAEPLVWLGLSAVAVGAWKLLLADLAARGETAVRLRSALVSGVVVVVLNLVLLPRFGLSGAGAATLVSSVCALAIVVAQWRRSAEQGLSELLRMNVGLRLLIRALRSTERVPVADEALPRRS